jgi:beta-phosphoglucomutase-like phosphatase (HAD superfamily)
VTASRNSGHVLATAGLDELFALVVDGADAASLHLAGKPAPDMFLETARRLGVQPEQAVVIKDAAAGVRAAVASRFGRVIGIDRGCNRGRLQAPGADLVVTDLAGVDVTASVLDSTPCAAALTSRRDRGSCLRRLRPTHRGDLGLLRSAWRDASHHGGG